MLLTVIDIATLLVAVVGATFAYFSLSVSGNATTTATVKTGKVPTITVSSPKPNLYLKVSATDMAQGDEPKYYYAKNEDCGLDQASCYTEGTASPDDAKYHDVLTVTVAEGDNDINYTCTGKIKVSSESLSTIEGLTTGDITIGLKNLDGNDSTATIDASIVKTNGEGASHDLKFKFNGDGSQTVKAYVLLTNSNTSDQSYLAGQTLNFTISSDDISCVIDAAPAA